jgi:hypothetical protein
MMQKENVGFLMSQASTVRIHIDGDTPRCYRKFDQSSITAYVVGEEGRDIISIVK